ncbi:hypothetical protein Glove_33g49 [Diversispora epigaea]|uniref:Protein kinase domain-containing protein n=1 Tax=Diversispora epigaea TaxID=1348612 RepID=A0A397JIW3_9GLOM|nr:hypothetical protein Glove_33g49 [Diversispora epigaea]
MPSGTCPECNQEYDWWCKPCNSKRLQNNFNNWTSGNNKIDKFIRDAQLNANYNWQVIEWILYDRFKDAKQIGQGGFGTIHYARWIDGYIEKWDIENQQWKRYGEVEVALKKFDNLVNFNDVLNEQKLSNLFILSLNVSKIHKLDIVHQDFHPGNILSSSFELSSIKISDFGLSKLMGTNPNNPEKKNIFGVLPYIAPEILSGDEEYTKAADVYSFGIIAYEVITGFPPYPDIPHDEDLAIKICNGLRPKIPFHTPKLITRIIMRCWDARVTHRPTFKELYDELYKCYEDYYYYVSRGRNKDSEIVIQIKKAEEFSANQESTNTTTTTPLNYQTHPQAIYTDFRFWINGDEEYTKAADVYSFGIIAYEVITGFPPYPDIPHDEDLAIKICNGLRPKIPFHTPKLITRIIMRCWDARVTHRPTFKELYDELYKCYEDYYYYVSRGRNKDSEIVIQIKKAEEFSANQESTNTTTTTPLNYQTHPQAIYTSRLLNFSKLPKPTNEENFERELEELTKSFSHINTNDDIDEF